MTELLPPSSPALLQQKSPSELIPMLKNAYAALKDKEKKIKVAATLGKTLLENNIALTSSYNQLYSSMNLISDHELDQDHESVIIEQPSSTREAHIEILEQRNSELSNRLESLLSNQEELDRSHMLHSRNLEHEIETLQHCLTSATNKIHEIQGKNGKCKKTLTKEGLDSKTCCLKANLEMEQLKIEFDHVSQLKLQKEKKLHESRHNTCILQQQCELSTHEYEKLKRTFEAQTTHVQELQTSVQQYEVILDRLQERGVLLAAQSEISWTTESVVHTTRPQQNLIVRIDRPPSPFYNENTTSFHRQVDSILQSASVVETEALEDALSLVDRLKGEYAQDRFLQNLQYPQDNLLATHAHYNADEIIYFLEQKQMQQQEEQAPSPITVYSSPPRNGLEEAVASILYLAWRWLLFSTAMFISIFDSVKKGPKGLDEK